MNANWIDPRCTEIERERPGRLVELSDGSVLTVTGNATRISTDDGAAWSEPRPIYEGPGPGLPGGGVLLRTRAGALVLVYVDRATFKWAWDNEKGEAHADVRGDVWAIRSLDGGRTWGDRQRLLDGYCGALIDIIETASGHVVVPIQALLRGPDRHGTYTYVSADQGKTWTRSNLIDLGGHGHHDGAFEATLAELRDGRLWMLLRTNWDRFWQAFSADHGLSWRVIEPSEIDASSSPGYLTRLASGRLALAWNRLYPQGKTECPRRGGQYSDVEASWQCEELSLAFSADDGATWSEPVVIAKGERLAYPYVFERRPGHLWIFAGKLWLSLQEGDFIAGR